MLRIDPALHAKIAAEAMSDGKSLNQFAAKVLRGYKDGLFKLGDRVSSPYRETYYTKLWIPHEINEIFCRFTRVSARWHIYLQAIRALRLCNTCVFCNKRTVRSL